MVSIVFTIYQDTGNAITYVGHQFQTDFRHCGKGESGGVCIIMVIAAYFAAFIHLQYELVIDVYSSILRTYLICVYYISINAFLAT